MKKLQIESMINFTKHLGENTYKGVENIKKKNPCQLILRGKDNLGTKPK